MELEYTTQLTKSLIYWHVECLARPSVSICTHHSFVCCCDRDVTAGVDSVDQVVGVVLGTPMLLGGLTALILDNTVSGMVIIFLPSVSSS